MITTKFQHINRTTGVVVSETVVALNKNEVKDASRIVTELRMFEQTNAQRTWDIWARSAPNHAAKLRRAAVAIALGLDPVVRYR